MIAFGVTSPPQSNKKGEYLPVWRLSSAPELKARPKLDKASKRVSSPLNVGCKSEKQKSFWNKQLEVGLHQPNQNYRSAKMKFDNKSIQKLPKNYIGILDLNSNVYVYGVMN
jgi:hypothetical protein